MTYTTRRELKVAGKKYAAEKRENSYGFSLGGMSTSLLDPPPRYTVPRNCGVDELASRWPVEPAAEYLGIEPGRGLGYFAHARRFNGTPGPLASYEPNLPAWW